MSEEFASFSYSGALSEDPGEEFELSDFIYGMGGVIDGIAENGVADEVEPGHT